MKVGTPQMIELLNAHTVRVVDRGELGYWLDGEPARLQDIGRAYNRVLTLTGLVQVGPPSWRV